MDFTLVIFLLVYLAMGVGHLPGFKLDRTGAAVVGAMVLLALGYLSPQAAWNAIDYNTIGLLFGLMVVSSAFVVSGFYDRAAEWVGGLQVSPPRLLAILIGVAGGLSAVLTNDVVVVAMTPVLVSITLKRGLNPIPFLLGFCFAANVGSAATIIGSPQNMIAAQALNISFTGFMKVSALPALLGLPLIWLTIALLYRGKWERTQSPSNTAAPSTEIIPFDRTETIKATVVTLIMVGAFVFSQWPHMLIALAGAAVLLINRSISSKDMLSRVDGNLLLLLIGLFIVNQAVAATHLPQHLLTALSGFGLHLNEPLSMLAVMSILSNVVGNNPAVMLVAPFLDGSVNPEALGAAIALGTGFSSNMVIFGSLAGIIVAEQGRVHGVAISFMEFTRAGLPVALLCLILAVGWILYLT